MFASKNADEKGLPRKFESRETINAEESVEGREDFVKGAEGFEEMRRIQHLKPAPDQEFEDPRPTHVTGGEDFVKEAEGLENEESIGSQPLNKKSTTHVLRSPKMKQETKVNNWPQVDA